MSFIGAAIIGGATAIIGGSIAASGAKSAAGTVAAAGDRSAQVQLEMFNTARADLAPWRELGTQAVYALQDMYFGRPPGTTKPQKSDYITESPTGFGIKQAFTQRDNEAGLEQYRQDLKAWEAEQAQADRPVYDWQTDPGYEFRLSEQNKAIERAQSAAGSRYGGRAIKEAIRYSGDFASKEYGNVFERLFRMANLGEAAGAQTAANAVTTGANVGSTYANTGANVAGYNYAGNMSIANTIGQVGQNFATLRAYNEFMK